MFYIKVFTFSPIQENTYILYNEAKEAIIIDPGAYFDEEREEMKNFISKNKLTPQILLNTHCHLDHIFGNKFIAETYDLKVQTHQLEEKMLSLAPSSALMYNLPFDNYTGEIIYLEEGDKIVLRDDELIALFIPGHSPGHLCFYCKKQQFLIGGDVLFKQSIGRTDLPFGSHEDLVNNIKKKLWPLPKEVIVYPGHGEPTTIGEEMATNPYLT